MESGARGARDRQEIVRNRMHRVWLCILSCLLFLSCTDKKAVHEQSDYEPGQILRSDKGALIPEKLVNLLEKNYIDKYRQEHPDNEISDVQLTLQIPRRLLNIKVYLREKNEGVLTQNSVFALPRGGGTIDLSDYVVEGRGVFYLGFDLDFSKIESDFSQLKVYFVSNSSPSRIGDEVYGAGCRHFFDITQYFHNEIRTRGLELAAADLRYLGPVLGTFFFVLTESDSLYVGSTSFVDSRYPDRHCQWLKASSNNES